MNKNSDVLPDLKQVAHIHAERLVGSLLALFGTPVVISYYKFILGSTKEKLFISGKPDVAGVAVLSLEPSSLMTRFFFSKWPAFIYPKALMEGVRFFFGSMNCFAPKNAVIEEIREVPEVVQLFTAVGQEHKGIASGLLGEVEKFLKQKGYAKYFVKTSSLEGNAALSFYRKRGFREVAKSQVNGESFSFLLREF